MTRIRLILVCVVLVCTSLIGCNRNKDEGINRDKDKPKRQQVDGV